MSKSSQYVGLDVSLKEQDDDLIEKQKASDALIRLGLAPALPATSGVRSPIQVIGFLDTAPPSAAGINAFRTALKEAGFVEGKNVEIDFRWTNNVREMHEFAIDMVRRHVDLLLQSTRRLWNSRKMRVPPDGRSRTRRNLLSVGIAN